ncbi:hypothetical protein ID866_4034 [Astraeus odoratus]|nr:hypothetical protein ID866_4034 [Astraeus odoratus]
MSSPEKQAPRRAGDKGQTSRGNAALPAPSHRLRPWVVGFAAMLAFAGIFLKRSTQVSDDYAVCSMSNKIYTVDDAYPNVQCIVVRDDHIADVGDLGSSPRTPITSLASNHDLAVDIQVRWRQQHTGSTLGHQLPWPMDFWQPSLRVSFVRQDSVVLPGLADAHAHLLMYGSSKLNVDVSGCTSKREVLDRLVAYVKARADVLNDPSCWITGMGWDQNLWTTARYPQADDFDTEPLLKGRRIYLERVDGHAVWVSRRVLQLMADLPTSVDGGEIIRDDTGKPTGIFVDNAMLLIPLPPPSEIQMSHYFDRAAKDALAVGLTSIHDAATELHAIDFYRRYAESKKLPLRLYLMGYMDSDVYWGDKLRRLIDHGISGRLNLRSVKIMSDGALGSFGAALLEPYSDNPSTNGLMRVPEEALSDIVKQFCANGWQVNIHCIGDRANRVVLNIFEDVSHDYNITELRPRIEHAQIMTLEDLERLGRLGVIPSVQPTHATSDMWYAEQRLGLERIKGAYAYSTMIRQSQTGVLPLGSDFPVEGINPLLGFYAAVTRLSISGESPHGAEGWYPAERLTRSQALKGMTLDAAYASFSESFLGSLTIGKKADFVVLDKDIMTVPAPEILETKVLATVIDGGVVYGEL